MTRALASLALLAAMATPAWADSGILPDPTLTPGATRSHSNIRIYGSANVSLPILVWTIQT